MDLDYLINNPSKSETYDDVEKTIANQMARFTSIFTDTKEPIESLKIVCSLGFDLWKTCGNKVCEDTNLTLVHNIRKSNYETANQFQMIANKMNNNDICVYLYLALPTIGNKVSRESLIGLCNNTIDTINNSYKEVSHMTNFKSINVNKVKSLYNEYLDKL